MKNRTFSLLAICAMATIFLALSTPAIAQFRTSIQGTVTDPSGEDQAAYFNIWRWIMSQLSGAEKGGKKANPGA